ncbi:MAG: hypothetical protein JW910_08940, partial [Anaerolineae bacterium]|nr:hypothetical protein [Anaerolineae bacterium]
DVAGQTASSDLALLARPKHLELPTPAIQADLTPLPDGRYRVRLTSDRPALWVWLEVPGQAARLSDNFFHLRPGQPAEIMVTLEDALPAEDFARRLVIRSLVDTYQAG